MRRLLVIASLLLASPAWAQGFPERPPRILGGFAAGGTSDTVNRILAESAAATLGIRPVVEVRTGANPPVDPDRDLVPIANFAHSTQAMVVAANSPHRTVADFLAAARQRPGTLTYASAGIGAVSHLSGARLEQLAGVRLVHVPFRGAAPGVLEVMAGRVDTIITNLGDAAAQIRAGELRLLAFADGIGSPAFPAVPQIAADVPGYAVSGWFGFCAPRGTPEPVLARWVEAIRAASQDAPMQRRLAESGLVPRFEDPSEFSRTISADRAGWREVIRGAGIRAE